MNIGEPKEIAIAIPRQLPAVTPDPHPAPERPAPLPEKEKEKVPA